MKFKLPSHSPKVIILRTLLCETTDICVVVDTGSYYTLVKPWVAQELGLDFDNAPTQTIIAGSGPMRVPLVTLPQVTVGDVTLSDVSAAVLDFQFEVGGLLGLTFLHRCRLVLDCRARVLELSAADEGRAANPA